MTVFCLACFFLQVWGLFRVRLLDAFMTFEGFFLLCALFSSISIVAGFPACFGFCFVRFPDLQNWLYAADVHSFRFNNSTYYTVVRTCDLNNFSFLDLIWHFFTIYAYLSVTLCISISFCSVYFNEIFHTH